MRKYLFLYILLSQSAFADVTVAAAASLAETMTALGQAFQKQTGIKVHLTFDASSRLAQQIAEGAKTQIFFSADDAWVEFLKKKNLVLKSEDLLSNQLVLITHKTQDYPAISNLRELPQFKFNKLALANEYVPAGTYAREALRSNEVLDKLKDKILSGSSVRNVLSWVSKNEADLGIVFLTDQQVDPRVKILYKIPIASHSKILYSLALIKDDEKKQATRFFEFLTAKKNRDVFLKAGFIISSP
jgi:molybdate transport system substrate-binding protein